MVQIDDDTLSDSKVGSGWDAQPGSLVLRIRGTDRDGQVVRLQSPKCTIGSDRRCTLQLDAAGIRPIHCLVIRGRRTTVVRRLGPDTRLNGSTFSDAELVPGDRLGIGPVEMEVVQANPLPKLPQSPKSQETRDSCKSENITERLNLTDRRRARQLIGQLRQAREEIQRLQGQTSQSSREAENGQAQLAAEWDRLRQEAGQVQAQTTALEQQRAGWTNERNEREKELAARLGEVNSRETELAARAEESNQQYRDVEARRAVLEADRSHSQTRDAELAELKEGRCQIDASRTELETQRSEFGQTRQQWEEERRTAKKRGSRSDRSLKHGGWNSTSRDASRTFRQAEIEAEHQKEPEARQSEAGPYSRRSGDRA